MSKFVPLRKAVDELGMHPNTLRKYADEGKIEVIRNEAGQRLFNVEGYVASQLSLVNEILLLIEKLSDGDRKELVKRLCQE